MLWYIMYCTLLYISWNYFSNDKLPSSSSSSLSSSFDRFFAEPSHTRDASAPARALILLLLLFFLLFFFVIIVFIIIIVLSEADRFFAEPQPHRLRSRAGRGADAEGREASRRADRNRAGTTMSYCLILYCIILYYIILYRGRSKWRLCSPLLSPTHALSHLSLSHTHTFLHAPSLLRTLSLIHTHTHTHTHTQSRSFSLSLS
jgi:hypothetical protein